MRVEARELVEMRNAVRRAVPRPFDSAICLKVSSGVLTGTAVGDGIWASYSLKVDTDRESEAVVGYRSLDVLDSMRGPVGLGWQKEAVKLDGNMSASLRTKEVDFSVFDKPEAGDESKWIELSARLSNLLYAAGQKKADADILWFLKDSVICGDAFKVAVLLDSPMAQEPIAVRATFVKRARGMLRFTENRVWSQRGNLTCSMPTFDKPPYLPHLVIAGEIGKREILASVAVDRQELLNLVKSLVVLSVDNQRPIGTIHVTGDGDTLRLDAAGNELGSGVAVLDATEVHGEMDVLVSPVYLHSAVVNSRGDKIVILRGDISYGDAPGSGAMLFVEDDEVRHGMALQGGSK